MPPASPEPSAAGLRVRDLRVVFRLAGHRRTMLDGVGFDLPAGGCLALVGESGSGKSLATLAILGLLPRPPLDAVSGSVRLGDTELLGLPERELERVRGARVGMVFQEPAASFNPVLRVGAQVAAVLEVHRGLAPREAWEAAVAALADAGLPEPARLARAWPHQLSGGLLQRVAIAAALAPEPEVLLADEPTTALDVTVQAGILDLLDRARRERGTAVLLVSHDLALVAGFADTVAVTCAGRLVERAPVRAIFAAPRHPYTRALLAAIPDPDRPGGRLASLPGVAARPDTVPGCPFHPRCPEAGRCPAPREVPPLRPVGGGGAPDHHVACHLAEPP